MSGLGIRSVSSIIESGCKKLNRHTLAALFIALMKKAQLIEDSGPRIQYL